MYLALRYRHYIFKLPLISGDYMIVINVYVFVRYVASCCITSLTNVGLFLVLWCIMFSIQTHQCSCNICTFHISFIAFSLRKETFLVAVSGDNHIYTVLRLLLNFSFFADSAKGTREAGHFSLGFYQWYRRLPCVNLGLQCFIGWYVYTGVLIFVLVSAHCGTSTSLLLLPKFAQDSCTGFKKYIAYQARKVS